MPRFSISRYDMAATEAKTTIVNEATVQKCNGDNMA
jgi:hypothetical protein